MSGPMAAPQSSKGIHDKEEQKLDFVLRATKRNPIQVREFSHFSSILRYFSLVFDSVPSPSLQGRSQDFIRISTGGKFQARMHNTTRNAHSGPILLGS